MKMYALLCANAPVVLHTVTAPPFALFYQHPGKLNEKPRYLLSSSAFERRRYSPLRQVNS